MGSRHGSRTLSPAAPSLKRNLRRPQARQYTPPAPRSASPRPRSRLLLPTPQTPAPQEPRAGRGGGEDSGRTSLPRAERPAKWRGSGSGDSQKASEVLQGRLSPSEESGEDGRPRSPRGRLLRTPPGVRKLEHPDCAHVTRPRQAGGRAERGGCREGPSPGPALPRPGASPRPALCQRACAEGAWRDEPAQSGGMKPPALAGISLPELNCIPNVRPGLRESQKHARVQYMRRKTGLAPSRADLGAWNFS